MQNSDNHAQPQQQVKRKRIETVETKNADSAKTHDHKRWNSLTISRISNHITTPQKLRTWVTSYLTRKYQNRCCDTNWQNCLYQWFDHLFNLCLESENSPYTAVNLFLVFLYSWRHIEPQHIKRRWVRRFFLYFSNRISSWYSSFMLCCHTNKGIDQADTVEIMRFMHEELINLKELAVEASDLTEDDQKVGPNVVRTRDHYHKCQKYVKFILQHHKFETILYWLRFLTIPNQEYVQIVEWQKTQPKLFDFVPIVEFIDTFMDFEQYFRDSAQESLCNRTEPARICLFDFPFLLNFQQRLQLLEIVHDIVQRNAIENDENSSRNEDFQEEDEDEDDDENISLNNNNSFRDLPPEIVEVRIRVIEDSAQNRSNEEKQEQIEAEHNSNLSGQEDESNDSIEHHTHIALERNRVLEGFINSLSLKSANARLKPLHIRFVHKDLQYQEIANDFGGVQREAFRLLVSELFANELLWEFDSDTGYALPISLHPDLCQSTNPEHKKLIESWKNIWFKIGMMIGIAVANGMWGVLFSSPLPMPLIMKLLRDENVEFYDFQSCFPKRAAMLEQMKSPDTNAELVFDDMHAIYSGIGINIVADDVSASFLSENQTIDLEKWKSCWKRAPMEVELWSWCGDTFCEAPHVGLRLDRFNKEQMTNFVDQSWQHFIGFRRSGLFGSMPILINGILKIIPAAEFHCFHPYEIKSIFDVEQQKTLLKNPTFQRDHFRLCKSEQKNEESVAYFEKFLNVISGFSFEEMWKLLMFISSDQDIVRKMQYNSLYIDVVLVKEKSNLLPASHTCSFQFDLPVYPTEAELKSKLLLILQFSESFGLV